MFLDKLNYKEVEEYLKKDDTCLIVTGSVENHGLHMPLGTDTFIPKKISELVDEKLKDKIMICPELTYGVTEDLEGFPGTVSLGVDLYLKVLNKILDKYYEYGFRHFVILNGHGGNSKAIEYAGINLWKKGAILARFDWWLIAGQINKDYKGGHGGGEETAGVMAVDPKLIKYEYINKGEEIINDLGEVLKTGCWNSVDYKGASVCIPRPVNSFTHNGWLTHGMGNDNPDRANPTWGNQMLIDTANYLCDFIEEFKKVKRG